MRQEPFAMPPTLAPNPPQGPEHEEFRARPWYRFQVDLSLGPVNLKDLIRDAERRYRGPMSTVRRQGDGPSTNRELTDTSQGGGGGDVGGVPSRAESRDVHMHHPISTDQNSDPPKAMNRQVQGGGGVKSSLAQNDPSGLGAVSASEAAENTVGPNKPQASDDGAHPDGTVSQGGSPGAGGWGEHGRLNLIEQLELRYGGGMASLLGASSDDDSSRGGGEGVVGEKKRRKRRLRKEREAEEIEYDSDDCDFIDDSELVVAFQAKEASKRTKTLHSGFFANSGEVETLGPAPPPAGARGGSGGGRNGANDLVTGRAGTKKKGTNKTAVAAKVAPGVGGAVGTKGVGATTTTDVGRAGVKKKRKSSDAKKVSELKKFIPSSSASTTTSAPAHQKSNGETKKPSGPKTKGGGAKVSKASAMGAGVRGGAVTGAGASMGKDVSSPGTAAPAVTGISKSPIIGGPALDPLLVAAVEKKVESGAKGMTGGAVQKTPGDVMRNSEGSPNTHEQKGVKATLGRAAGKLGGECGPGGVDSVVSGDGGRESVSGSNGEAFQDGQGKAVNGDVFDDRRGQEGGKEGKSAEMVRNLTGDVTVTASGARAEVGTSATNATEGTVRFKNGAGGNEDSKVGVEAAAGGTRGKKGVSLIEEWEAGATAEEALSRFEHDHGVWVSAGRPMPACKRLPGSLEDDKTCWVLEPRLRHTDALVRASQPDALDALPYLRRLGNILGQSPEDVRSSLAALEHQELREEASAKHIVSDLKHANFMSELEARLEVQRDSGRPFQWDIELRKAMHDRIKAFISWNSAELSAPRPKGSKEAAPVGKSKGLKDCYNQLAAAWPPHMPMTEQDLRKMYQLEKRRQLARANGSGAGVGCAGTGPAMKAGVGATGSKSGQGTQISIAKDKEAVTTGSVVAPPAHCKGAKEGTSAVHSSSGPLSATVPGGAMATAEAPVGSGKQGKSTAGDETNIDLPRRGREFGTFTFDSADFERTDLQISAEDEELQIEGSG